MPDKVKRVIAILLVLLVALKAEAQDFSLQHFTVDDGLPSNKVYQVHRDHKGFLWFATDKGVARYNGIRFEKVTTENGLPDNEVFYFNEDAEGRLWVGCFNGELAYYQNGVFHTGENTPSLKLPFNESFTGYIRQEYDGTVTAGYNDHIVNIRGGKATTFSKKRLLALTGTAPASFGFSKKTGPAIYRFYSPAKIVTVDTLGNILHQVNVTDPVLALVLSQGTYAFYTANGIVNDELQYIKRFRPDFEPAGLVHQFGIFGRDTFYATRQGLYINDTLKLLPGIEVSNITSDHHGDYWVSTLTNGVYNFSSNYRGIYSFKDVYKGIVSSSAVRDGHLLFVAGNSIFDLRGNKVETVVNFAKQAPMTDEKSGTASYIDHLGRAFIFGNKGVLFADNLLSPASRKSVRLHEYLSIEPKEVLEVNGTFLVRAFKRVESIAERSITDGRGLIAPQVVLSRERVASMAQAPDSSVWFSGAAQMHRFVRGQQTIQEQFRNIPFKYFQFFGNGIVGYTHKNQLLWCTNITGVVHVDTIKHQNCLWDKFNALDDSTLLVATNGQYRILSLRTFGGKQAISVSVVENTYVPLRAESIAVDSLKCYFFKNGAITVVSKKSILAKSTPPELFFTFLRTGVRVTSIKREMKINFDEAKNITVGFTTLSMGAKDVRYLYSLSRNGVDNWRPVQGEQINIVNSGYGKFHIKVRARTLGSDYCAPIVFTLYVSRPFWASWWFIAIAGFCLLLMVAIALRLRIRFLLNRKEKEYNSQIRFLRSEYKAMNALMNPHFIFNTLNNVQSLVNANDKLAANEYLRIFADLVRQNMHNVSQEMIPLRKEMDLVSNYLMLEKLRFEDKLNYDISLEIDFHLSETLIPPLILQPLVENAIKHGILKMKSGQGFIKVKVYEENDNLYMEVRDNGGTLASQSGNAPGHISFGTGNIRKRVEQLSLIQGKKIQFALRSERDEQGVNWTVATLCMPM